MAEKIAAERVHPGAARGFPGQSLIIITFAFFGLIGFVGFAIDTGIIYLHRVWLGQAIDSAALAAGYELPNIEAACSRAVEYLRTNDYVASSDFAYKIIFTSEPDAPGGDPGEFVIDSVLDSISDPVDCTTVSVPAAHENVHFHVRVEGDQTVPVFFMQLLGFDSVNVGTPATAKRTALYDVAIVLDRSGSMSWDTCEWIRPADGYACENRFSPCTTFFTEDFEGQSDIGEFESDSGWYVTSPTPMDQIIDFPDTGHGAGQGVRLIRTGVVQPDLFRTVDTSGQEDVTLYFWALNDGLDSSDYARIFWRQNDSVGWSALFSITGTQLGGSWKQYAVVIESEQAENNPNLQIRFATIGAETGEGFFLDDVELKSCPLNEGPWINYDSQCTSVTASLKCGTAAPNTLLPGVSEWYDQLPRTTLMEQPMTDVIRSAADFIDILDDRRLPGQPRTDQLGLATFSNSAERLFDLTLDYEAIKATLYTISSGGYTNTPGGMRVGLSILADGRPTTTHFMVLLTDGYPNRYDTPYINPTNFNFTCGSGVPCQQTLEYIEAQIGEAQRQNVTIFTIGLGEQLREVFSSYGVWGPGYTNITGQDLLRRIAEQTGGDAYFTDSTEELREIFEWIADAIFVRLTL